MGIWSRFTVRTGSWPFRAIADFACAIRSIPADCGACVKSARAQFACAGGPRPRILRAA